MYKAATISTYHVSQSSMYCVEKFLKRSVTKYTVEEAKTFVENYDLDFAPELILYQLGYNDINS